MSGESSTQMQIDKPPKLDVEAYIAGLLSTVPQDLHPLVESFGKLHRRRHVVIFP